MLAAIKYSYLNAKTRTMHSKRLRASDWHILENTKDRDSFLHYLSTTSYGPVVIRLMEQKEQSEEAFEKGLFTALFDDYDKILRSLSDAGAKELVLSLFSRFEAENLKIVLRAIFSGLKKIHISHLLYPVEKISKIQWDKLWQQKDVKGAVKVLAVTPFGAMLNHVLSQFEAQGRLFPLEMAIDIACFRRIAGACEAVSGRTDRKRVKGIVGSYIDALNISHIARLRFVYRLSPEEALNYSYSGGRILNLKALHDLARAQDMPALAKAVPEPFMAVVQDVGRKDLSLLRLRLEDWLLKRLRRAFLGNPFHLGVQVAHLLEKEMEIRSLISLYQAKVRASGKRVEDVIPEGFLKEGVQIVQAG